MCCAPRSTPLLCKHDDSHQEDKEVRKMADQMEAEDKAKAEEKAAKAEHDAEMGHSGSHDSADPEGPSDSK